MSRNNGYNNPLDEDDDGEDLEITDEDEAGSDEQGRDEAALCLRTGRSVRGNGKYDEQHRRMWFRMAQKALAQGQERREEAEAAAKAEAAAEKARAAAEEQGEREQIAREAKEQRHRERFERSMRESDERWERLNEQTREENAAWEADRPERERREREAAAPRPAAAVRVQPHDARPALRPPATMNPLNATTARSATKSAPPATVVASPSASRSSTVPTQPASPMRGQTPRQRCVQSPPPPPHRIEPERRVVAPLHAQPSRTDAPAAATPASGTPSTLPARVVTRTPAPTPPQAAPRALKSPATATLTGADLAAWRSARGLTQRPAAELLGVAPSTVAKAELLPGKVLGEHLQVALAAALAR